MLLTSPVSESNTHKLKPYRLTSLILVEHRKVLYTTPTLGELNLFEDHTYVARIAPNIRFRRWGWLLGLLFSTAAARDEEKHHQY